MKNPIVYFILCILVNIILITIGYSAFSAEFRITNTVATIRAYKEVRINSVSSNSSGIDNLEYTHKSVISTVTIPAGGSITYNVTITNLGNDESVPIAVSNVTFTNGSNQQVSNLSANIDDEHYVKICDNGNCIGPVNQTISVTVTNNGSEPISTNLNTNLTFSKVYSVTYNNEYQGEVLEGHTYEYTFTSDTPSTVTVDSGTCGTPTITNDTLTISNVRSNLVLTGTTSGMSGRGTWDDPYIITTSTYDYSNLSAGSYKFTDPAVKGNPEITVDSNGKVIRYELTNYGTSGITTGSGNVIDTGVLAFDGANITIHLEFTATINNNVGKHILAALKKNDNNTYTGFYFVIYKKANIRTYSIENQTISNAGYGGTYLYQYSLKNQTANANTAYVLDITYNQSTKTLSSTLNPGNNSGTSQAGSHELNGFPDNVDNATITLGGDGVNTTYDISSMNVTNFTVTKG